jgi:hypothetical protein
VEFDGVDDYLVLPMIDALQSISLWVKIDPVQPSLSSTGAYLLDTRYGTIDGYWSSRCVSVSLTLHATLV